MMTGAENPIKKDHPTVLTILGATGDLMSRKIVPALYHLFIKNKLPKHIRIIGFARRSLTADNFRAMVRAMLDEHLAHSNSSLEIDSFIKLFSYQQGEFGEQIGYQTLGKTLGVIDGKWHACANKLFYLAVPPLHYELIFRELKRSGLSLPCSDDTGWTRILVEKPFGHDALTAERLDLLLAQLFKEEQIYRIDHYLAKEMLQNILSFRFANNLFEKSWSNKTIERVEIRLWEKIGVEKRGPFYDGVGALRDVGQNHILQMLALVAMDVPISLDPAHIREKRAQLLKNIHIPNKKTIATHTYRAQYDGYNSIPGVAPRSMTETYFAATLELKGGRWRNVPFYIESGKRMGAAKKEIIVTFKHPTPCLCPPGSAHEKNVVMFQLEPKEAISMTFLAKKPGLDYFVEEKKFEYQLRSSTSSRQYVEEYEKLLLDAIQGDQTLFISTRELKNMWAVIDPIVRAWQKNLVHLDHYAPDTTDAAIAAQKKLA